MNKYLEQAIRIKLLKMGNEIITNDDLAKITELGLNNVTFSDKPKEISLHELKKFPNLHILTLQNFLLKDDELKLISEFKNLKTLHIASCQIESDASHQFPSLENLSISTSQFKDFPKIILPKIVTVNSINRNINLEEFQGIENVESLRLTNIKRIQNFDVVSHMMNLVVLNIDGSKVDNKNVLEEIKKRIPVSHESHSYMIR